MMRKGYRRLRVTVDVEVTDADYEQVQKDLFHRVWTGKLGGYLQEAHNQIDTRDVESIRLLAPLTTY